MRVYRNMVYDALFDVSKETVVITGGAGQLGQAYTKAFLARGAKVVCIDLHPTADVQNLLAAFPDAFFFKPASVTEKQSLEQALKSIQDDGLSPTVLICNAALDSPPSAPEEENGPFEGYPESSWDKVMDVNLKGVFLSCQVFGSVMAACGKGSIIIVCSIYGVVAPDQSIYEYRRNRGEIFYKPVAYSASKSGVLNLSRYLAVYWAQKGVRVNAITLAGVYNKQEEAFLDAYCARIPIGRMANADEYNGAVLFLASNASSYMTGSNMVIDGGWTAI